MLPLKDAVIILSFLPLTSWSIRATNPLVKGEKNIGNVQLKSAENDLLCAETLRLVWRSQNNSSNNTSSFQWK